MGAGTAAATGVSAGVKPDPDTGAELAARGEAVEVGDASAKATGVAAGAFGTSPIVSLAAGDVVCADGEATAAEGVDSLGRGDSMVKGVGTTPAVVRGSCVTAGCPYAAGVTATGLR